MFAKNLEEGITVRRKQSKEPQQIRYVHYMGWAVALRKKNIAVTDENSLPQYSFPEIVLKYIRLLVPGNIKGELWEDAYELNMGEFCEGLEIPKI